MSAAHSVLPPSGAAAWVVCAGWVLMNQMYPESDKYKTDSAEGTASHWAGFEMLYGRPVAVGQVAPNDVVLNAEMIEGAELYVAAIDEALAKYGLTRADLHVEERIDIPGIHIANWGTPDCWFYVTAQAVLVVFDYKFGHGFVEVFENWQLIDYTAGILDKLGVDGLRDQATRVEMCVVQPRSYHRDGPVRTWSVVASSLRGYFNQLIAAADKAIRGDGPCVPNPECVHCKGRHACEALQRDAYRSAQISTASLPVELSPNAIGLELHFLRAAAKRLDGRITGLEEQAKGLISRGQVVAFHALEPTQGREVWNKPIDEIIELGKLFGVELAKRDAITPNQAVKAGLSAEVVTMYTERKRGVQLVPDNGQQARKVFAK